MTDRRPNLIIRPARAEDVDRIGHIIFDEPPAEAVWMTGSKKKARKLGLVMATLPGSEMTWENTTVAEIDGKVVGILQPAAGGDGGLQVGPRLVWHTLRIVGPIGAVRLLPRMRVRERLNFPAPDGAYHLAELHVDSELRGQGIAGALLAHAEQVARSSGRTMMSLTTQTSNPARRLYTRHGYEVAGERTDPEYKKGTGSDGRVLMTKRLK